MGNKRTWFSRFLRKDPILPESSAGGPGDPASEPPPDGMLLIVSGRMAGQSFPLKPGKTYTCGRASTCAVCLTEEGISRNHFAIEAKQGTYVLSDLGSSNGTFVNDRPVKQVVLQNRDRIRAGATEMQFNLKASTRPGPAPSASPAVAETTIRRRIEEDQIGGTPGRAQDMLRILYKVGNVINAESSGEKIFSAIIDCVFQIFEANRAFLLLYDADTGLFERVAGRSPAGDQKELNLSKTILLESVKKGLSILSSDTMHDERFKSGESIVMQNIRSAMCVPLEAKKEVIGALYVDNISIKDAFSEFDLEMLSAMGKQAGVALMKLKLAEENARLFYSAIRTIVSTIEAKDHYTGGHTERVASYAIHVAEEMGLEDRAVEDLKLAGLLHDVGKIGIPEKILKKPGRLTPGEYEIMKRHSAIGAEIAAHIEYIDDVRDVILHHHEKWDGTGYPDGLKGVTIPLGARILAVADAFDAMTSHRTYRRDFSMVEVLAEFRRCSGNQFDPDIVDAFLRAQEKGKLAAPEVLDLKEILPDPIPD